MLRVNCLQLNFQVTIVKEKEIDKTKIEREGGKLCRTTCFMPKVTDEFL